MLKKSNTSGSDSETGSKCLRIRAHHLCCIQGFQGYGYSPVFVANLRAVISYIKAFPSRPLELVSECDVICASCPSKRECIAQKSIVSRRIRNMDLVVMEKLKIKEGTIMEADEAFRLINSQLANASDIEEICGTCKWRQKCLWYMQDER
ncbi:DUF1284 domain-containing protein [Methanosarcina sp.]|uniref:DUF1284 domain-containing protein n=1 Tax=Methanosarcina sp. TaxID=2213 RepID=UPI003C748AD3